LTKKGYDHIMSLEDKQLAVVLLSIFEKLRVFEHWPAFLVGQELRKVDRQPEHSNALTGEGMRRCAFTVLERYMAHHMHSSP
jgi:hypothetical protein